jgi:hypothetical protein
VELVVLRHKLLVLARQQQRPKLRSADRALILRLLVCFHSGAGMGSW